MGKTWMGYEFTYQLKIDVGILCVVQKEKTCQTVKSVHYSFKVKAIGIDM